MCFTFVDLCMKLDLYLYSGKMAGANTWCFASGVANRIIGIIANSANSYLLTLA